MALFLVDSRQTRVLLLIILGVASLLFPGGSWAADPPAKNVELAGALTAPWPTSEEMALASGVAFFQAIDSSTQQIMGVAVVDVSSPDAPSHTATISDTFLEKLYTNGSYLLGETKAGTNSYEIHVYSLQGTAQPAYKGRAATDGWPVYADSQYALVRTRAGNLSTIDLANPDNGVYPVVGGYSGADKLLSMTTTGPLAYAGIANGIKVFSLGTPTAPAELGVIRFDKPYGNVYQITVAGSYLYAKAGSSLLVIDVSDAGHPALAAAGPIPGFNGDVVAAGSLLYTANSDGLHVYSLANPLAPVEAGYYREQAGGQWMHILAQGATVYATVRFNTFPGQAELRVLRFTGVPTLELQAGGAGVTVNGATVTPGSAQALQEGDQIEIAVDGGPAQMQVRCEDVVDFLILLYVVDAEDTYPEEFTIGGPVGLLFTANFIARACGLGALSRAGPPVDVALDLTLQSGGLRLQGADPGAQVTISTTEASAQMVGKGEFVAAHPSAGVTTTVLSLAGPVVVTPKNSNLAPVTLGPGDWTRVTAAAITPVQSIFTEHIYLPALAR